MRALARDAQRGRGGPGVGAVGVCLTGGFALAMLEISEPPTTISPSRSPVPLDHVLAFLSEGLSK